MEKVANVFDSIFSNRRVLLYAKNMVKSAVFSTSLLLSHDLTGVAWFWCIKNGAKHARPYLNCGTKARNSSATKDERCLSGLSSKHNLSAHDVHEELLWWTYIHNLSSSRMTRSRNSNQFGVYNEAPSFLLSLHLNLSKTDKVYLFESTAFVNIFAVLPVEKFYPLTAGVSNWTNVLAKKGATILRPPSSTTGHSAPTLCRTKDHRGYFQRSV